MKFFVAFLAIAAVAVAEPESDAQHIIASPYHHAGVFPGVGVAGVAGIPSYAYNGVPSVYTHGAVPQYQYAQPQSHPAAHHTSGLKAYSNGAVVPEDTLSVKAAKVQHYSAKANAYAQKSMMYAHNPAAYATYGAIPSYAAYNPMVHGVRVARDADSDSQYYTTGVNAYSGLNTPYAGIHGVSPISANYYSHGINGYATPSAYSTYGSVVRPAVSAYSGVHPVAYSQIPAYTTGHAAYNPLVGYSGVHSIGKRDADSDSQYFGNAYNTGLASPAYSGINYGHHNIAYNSAVRPTYTTGYNTVPYTGYSGAYSSPAYSTYGGVYNAFRGY